MPLTKAEETVTMPPQLPVWRTVMQAYAFVWKQKYRLMKLAFLPLVFLLIGQIIFSSGLFIKYGIRELGLETSGAKAAFALVSGSISGLFFVFILTTFSVVWHRHFILKSEEQHIRDLIRWRKRHVKFLILAATFGGVGFVLSAPIIYLSNPLIINYAFELTDRGPESLYIILMAGVAGLTLMTSIGAFLSARWCIMFPALAIDHLLSFRQSWKTSSGNGLRLTGIIILSTLPIQIVANVSFRAFPLWEPFLGFNYLLAAISYFVITAVGVSALSASYQLLCMKDQKFSDVLS